MIRRLRWWIVKQRDLARMLDDAHRALRSCHKINVRLTAQVAERDQALAMVEDCPGWFAHVQLAHRLEMAELAAVGGER